MRVLFAVHVGETFGHLARALSVADAIGQQGPDVYLATSAEAAPLLESRKVKFVPIRWDWSHNAITSPLTGDYIARVTETNQDLLDAIERIRPDIVAGFPGVFSAQSARRTGTPHVSFLHGPYLSPLAQLTDPTWVEQRIIDFARSLMVGGTWDELLDAVAHNLGLPAMTYGEYLSTEQILITQPELQLRASNLHEVGFITASLGADASLPIDDYTDSCYVTFGTGDSGDLSGVITVCRQMFRHVIVTTGRGGTSPIPVASNVVVRELIPSSSLAGRVRVVVTHGGIGTVGTFALAGTPLLICPTEIDQATMSVHAKRAEWAAHYGLEAWAKRPQLGRRVPRIDPERLQTSISDTVGRTWIRPKDLGGALAAAELVLESARRPAIAARA